MFKHHKESINNLIKMYEGKDDILAIILGGSIAKGEERPDSDIDVIIIVSEDMYSQILKENRLSECSKEGCTYEKGYFDIKYFTKDFIVKASKVGSEPTRNSFVASRCVYSVDAEIPEIISKIPIYPVWEKEERIKTFYSALILNKGYFWHNAEQSKDKYLQVRVASDVVLYGMRLLYAYNEKLFPCHKWLLRSAEDLKLKPNNIIEKANIFLDRLDDDSKEAFVNAILNFCDWDIDEGFSPLSRFVIDNEQWWYHNRPNMCEW